MGFIKNFSSLASTPDREKILTLVEAGLRAIQPEQVVKKQVVLHNTFLRIQENTYNLTQFERIFLVGIGKGSGSIASILENILGEHLTDGYVIDNVRQTMFHHIRFTLGTHPLPSETNIAFTKNVLQKLNHLSEKDLVLVVVCGGGSAIFEAPARIDLKTVIHTFKELLNSGAAISEINVVRKHLSLVKGGNFAKHLYPATIVSLLFSDVPGNDISVIASGPTVKDEKTVQDAIAILQKYHITSVSEKDLIETPKEDKYFAHVSNLIMVSNMTAIKAINEKAKSLDFLPRIFSDRVEGGAKTIGRKLIDETKKGELLISGGETTVHVSGKGRGGRNQEVVLGGLPYVGNDTIIVSWDSDGIDFDTFSGAIGDKNTVKKAQSLGLDGQEFLANDNALVFFEKTGDGILTGKLESNVSDLFLVYKK
ncbi:MAG TPA: DUF4147 domain-containing protein [Patescibacteria group bacterium]|nr:DUF4147 domain-containing protein [Patescibacteria group bacterium]